MWDYVYFLLKLILVMWMNWWSFEWIDVIFYHLSFPSSIHPSKEVEDYYLPDPAIQLIMVIFSNSQHLIKFNNWLYCTIICKSAINNWPLATANWLMLISMQMSMQMKIIWGESRSCCLTSTSAPKFSTLFEPFWIFWVLIE